MKTSFLGSRLLFPDKDFPEKNLLFSSCDVFGVLESFMKDVLVEDSKNVLFNTSKEFKEILMDNFSRIEHRNQHLVLNSQKFLKNVNFIIDEDILQQDNIVAFRCLIIGFILGHVINVDFTTKKMREKLTYKDLVLV